MPEGLREDPYHWTELPSLNKELYYYYYMVPMSYPNCDVFISVVGAVSQPQQFYLHFRDMNSH